MSQIPQIHHYKRDQIDTAKWDACIDRAPNGIIYATSAWLDKMAKNWDGLVLGDYEYIMPLTWNKKWGIPYLYQPPFTAALGIIGPTPIPIQTIDTFIAKAKKHFRFAEIYLNHSNPHPQLQPFSNYELDLSPPHTTLSENYKKDLQKNLHRSQRFLLRYNSSDSPAQIIDLHRQYYQDRMPHVRQQDFDAVLSWCLETQPTASNLGEIENDSKPATIAEATTIGKPASIAKLSSIGEAATNSKPATTGKPASIDDAASNSKPATIAKPATIDDAASIGEPAIIGKAAYMTRTVSETPTGILSSALLLRHKNRIYLLMTTTPPVGRKTQAHHFLMDNIIAEFAGQNLILDFVGSDVPGVAHFYENFGAHNKPYFFCRFNNLPWPLRWLKR